MAIINRMLNEENFLRLQADFKFLPKLIASSHGQLDLAIRDNYLNIYYRGYSLAKIRFKKQDQYKIWIHEKFWKGPIEKNKAFNQPASLKNNYKILEIDRTQLHPFFQMKHLKGMFQAIKRAGHSEELVFEQVLIVDNRERSDWLIIDRQVKDKKYDGRLDLLALKRQDDNKFRFVVLEVKLGNNRELTGEVEGQLNGYMRHIEKPAHFQDYKKCYEAQYRQKRALGLFEKPSHAEIEIVKGVEGVVVVGGYSVEAKKAIRQLKRAAPGITVKHFRNELD